MFEFLGFVKYSVCLQAAEVGLNRMFSSQQEYFQNLQNSTQQVQFRTEIA